MATIDLIDTTEMYLKTIYEMEEDGVTPLRARIVERLEHSGPTVSQTIARMERDGLVWVRSDRRLELKPRGREIAVEVMRKHRLAERLLVDVIGMSWLSAHDEACRWEHVMSDAVEQRLDELLSHPTTDPYGNPIPGFAQVSPDEVSLESAARDQTIHRGVISRIGEPIQADRWELKQVDRAGIRPGNAVEFWRRGDLYEVWNADDSPENASKLGLESLYAPHLFLTAVRSGADAE